MPCHYWDSPTCISTKPSSSISSSRSPFPPYNTDKSGVKRLSITCEKIFRAFWHTQQNEHLIRVNDECCFVSHTHFLKPERFSGKHGSMCSKKVVSKGWFFPWHRYYFNSLHSSVMFINIIWQQYLHILCFSFKLRHQNCRVQIIFYLLHHSIQL